MPRAGGSHTSEHIDDQDDEPNRRERLRLPLQEQIVRTDGGMDEEHARAALGARGDALGPNQLPIQRRARLARILHRLRMQPLAARQRRLDILVRSPGVDEYRCPREVGRNARIRTGAITNQRRPLGGRLDFAGAGSWLQAHHERAARADCSTRAETSRDERDGEEEGRAGSKDRVGHDLERYR